MNPFAQVRDTIAILHPDAPWVALTLGIWIVQWACRRWAPGLWQACFRWVPEDTGKMARAVMMGLPSVVVGAALPAMAAGVDWKAAAVGAAMGALAPVWHHVLRAAPGPYQGALKLPATDRPTPAEGSPPLSPGP